jgi:hypothetical protein
VIPFSAKRQSCGRQARAFRGKSIGPVISDCGFRIFWVFFFNPHSAIGIPQFGGGRLYNRITLSWGKKRLARPNQKMNRASWFLRETPLLPGRAPAEIQ